MTQDKNRLKRNWVEQAVSLALRGRWDEAVCVNDRILSLFPDDADAYNRLGKAYTELGRYADAHAAYGHTLRIDAFQHHRQEELAAPLHAHHGAACRSGGDQVVRPEQPAGAGHRPPRPMRPARFPSCFWKPWARPATPSW